MNALLGAELVSERDGDIKTEQITHVPGRPPTSTELFRPIHVYCYF